MRGRVRTFYVMAHGLAAGMVIQSDTDWTVQSVAADPRALDRVVISGEDGRTMVADRSDWFKRVL